LGFVQRLCPSSTSSAQLKLWDTLLLLVLLACSGASHQ
jgi:hypothetical protein